MVKKWLKCEDHFGRAYHNLG